MPDEKLNLLFMTDTASKFDVQTAISSNLFKKVDVVLYSEADQKPLRSDLYDIVIGDLSVDPERVGVLKQIKDNNGNVRLFAMVDPKDTEKLYKIADMGINAFELLPEQFTMALEEIVRFVLENPEES